MTPTRGRTGGQGSFGAGSYCREPTQCVQMQAVVDEPIDAMELPLELLDAIVRLGGWRTWGLVWSKVCQRLRPVEWWLKEGAPHDRAELVVVSPGVAGGLNAGIARASRLSAGLVDAVVLVRPGVYREAIRMTANGQRSDSHACPAPDGSSHMLLVSARLVVSLCALGPCGSAVVRAPGWEPAIAWGGYKVQATSAIGVALEAAPAGASSEVCGFTLITPNQYVASSTAAAAADPR